MSTSVFLPSYSVGSDCYQEIPAIAGRYGRTAVIIGGKQALAAAEDKIRAALQDSEIEVLDTLWYGGDATFENGDALKADPAVQKADMIFGVGGGRALDTCKYVADQLDKPLFCFPTVGSNCAAVTAISVHYNADGTFRDYYYSRLAAHTFIDTEIIARSPVELLWAGIGDALSKECEAVFSSRNHELLHTPLMEVQLSGICTEPLLQYGPQALEEARQQEPGEALEQVVLDIIVSTGLVSNFTTQLPDYYYNSSLAHCVYYGATITDEGHKHRHGEVVSLGVLCLLTHDQQAEQQDRIMAFNHSIGLPVSFDELGIREEEFEAMADYVTSHCTEWQVRDPSITREDFIACMRNQNEAGRAFLQQA